MAALWYWPCWFAIIPAPPPPPIPGPEKACPTGFCALIPMYWLICSVKAGMACCVETGGAMSWCFPGPRGSIWSGSKSALRLSSSTSEGAEGKPSSSRPSKPPTKRLGSLKKSMVEPGWSLEPLELHQIQAGPNEPQWLLSYSILIIFVPAQSKKTREKFTKQFDEKCIFFTQQCSV